MLLRQMTLTISESSDWYFLSKWGGPIKVEYKNSNRTADWWYSCPNTKGCHILRHVAASITHTCDPGMIKIE